MLSVLIFNQMCTCACVGVILETDQYYFIKYDINNPRRSFQTFLSLWSGCIILHMVSGRAHVD